MLPLPLLLLLAAGPVVVPEPAVPSPAATNQLSSPVFAEGGYVKPAEVEKGCVGRNVRVPNDLAQFSGSVTTKFAVMRDGSVKLFEALSDAPEPLVNAIWQAIQGCKFTPGLDAKGTPVNIWMILPFHFKLAGEAAVVQPPQEVEPGCIDNQLKYRLPPNRLSRGTLSVQVGVSLTGELSNFRFPADLPDDVMDALRLSIQACRLQPALDWDGSPIPGTFKYGVNFQLGGGEATASGRPAH